ncbi:MAG: hypothetical protein ABIH01_02615 [Candidatus Omnitrophota bacterium]
MAKPKSNINLFLLGIVVLVIAILVLSFSKNKSAKYEEQAAAPTTEKALSQKSPERTTAKQCPLPVEPAPAASTTSTAPKTVPVSKVQQPKTGTYGATAKSTTASAKNPVTRFFERLFTWPFKIGKEAGITTVDTAVQAGKTGLKTAEDTGMVLIGKEGPQKLVTTPVGGTIKTGTTAVTGSAETVKTTVTECPVYPDKK